MGRTGKDRKLEPVTKPFPDLERPLVRLGRQPDLINFHRCGLPYPNFGNYDVYSLMLWWA